VNSLKLSNLPGLLHITEEFMHSGDRDTLCFTLVSSEYTGSNTNRITESVLGSFCVVEVL